MHDLSIVQSFKIMKAAAAETLGQEHLIQLKQGGVIG